MPKTDNKSNFSFKYRADCIDCQKYVSKRKRATQQEAEEDALVHNAIPGNNDHDVKIEVTQTFHIAWNK